jgi:hypothetical protein
MARALLRLLRMSTHFLIIALVSAVGQAAEMPVTASHLVTGTPSHVQVSNTSRQVVTAWSLETKAVNGDRTHREVTTADGYLSEVTHGLAGAPQRLDRLAPGESREVALDPLPEGATVNVIAVVFDDGTAAGDETVIASIFARRAKERDALGEVVNGFKDVLQARQGADALAALRERFAALAQRDDSVPCRAALDAVQNYARKGNADEINQSLQTYAAFVTKEYDLAVKHATRRSL